MSNRSFQIPNKSLFKINEVCGMTGVKPYVLRFWETEFNEISPLTSSTGQKLYEHKDIEIIMLIKKLLFDDKLSVDEVKLELPLKLPHSEGPSLSSDEPPPIIESEMNLIGLSSQEIQKLVTAKENLKGLLNFAESIKQRYNW